MKDRYSDDQPSKPAAGGDTSRHAGKDNISTPSAGVTLHPDKAAYDQQCGKSGLSKPSAGSTPHNEKQDGKNREEAISNPEGALGPVPKDRQHLDKVRAHATGTTHEPKAKGKYPTGQSTTKVK